MVASIYDQPSVDMGGGAGCALIQRFEVRSVDGAEDAP
jgi:hypothetical protein